MVFPQFIQVFAQLIKVFKALKSMQCNINSKINIFRKIQQNLKPRFNYINYNRHIMASQIQTTAANSTSQIQIKIPQSHPCSTTYQLLKYEWIIFTILALLLLSSLTRDFYNFRIVLYCLLFLLLETLRTTHKCLEIQDPLELSPARKFSKEISILIQLNMTYLLFRILIDYHNIQTFLLLLHYTVMGILNFDKNKKKYDIQLENPSLWKITTPFLLFLFTIIISRHFSEVSLAQLILLAMNLVLTIEIKMLLINKQCLFFGWEKQGFEGKNHSIFSKYQAIRKIMFFICAAVAIQNLLFVIPSMNQYPNITMFYSLILGGYIFSICKKSQTK